MSTTTQEIQALIEATGKYKLESENTEGANAYAFHAKHVLLGQPVFLKVFYADSDVDFLPEPRLLVEATKTDEGDSNLVRVYDAQRLGPEFVLVAMEYVEEGSVLSRLRSGPLPLRDAVGGAIGILHGLAQLHKGLLVHRDIKPANVLLATRHGRIWPKITDFGSVAQITHPEASVKASRHSALYSPPEGWESPSRYDVRSDLYQVGLVLFEMAHGPLPYKDESYLDQQARKELRELARSPNGIEPFDRQQIINCALARAAAGSGLTRFGKKQPYVSTRLTRIINKATAPDPTVRYQKPSDMIGDLEALRIPNWQLSTSGSQYVATGWAGWDWTVSQATSGRGKWLVLRRRQAPTSFRRCAETESARDACRIVARAAK